MAKRIITAILVCLPLLMGAQTLSDDFKAANYKYAAGDFQAAIEQYESIVDSGFVSGDLYFNLGNAFYKSGQLAPAILNYERAKLYMPKDKDLEYNLAMSQQMVVDKIDLVDVFFLERWLISFSKNLSSDQWAFVGVAGFLLFIVALVMFTFSGSAGIKRTGFFLGIIMLLVSAVSFNYSVVAKKRITEQNGAIIFSPTVTIKGSPDESGTELFILHEGTKVNVTDSVGDWNEIVLGDGNVGWIKKDALKRI